jgi:hypothetical protein
MDGRFSSEQQKENSRNQTLMRRSCPDRNLLPGRNVAPPNRTTGLTPTATKSGLKRSGSGKPPKTKSLSGMAGQRFLQGFVSSNADGLVRVGRRAPNALCQGQPVGAWHVVFRVGKGLQCRVRKANM